MKDGEAVRLLEDDDRHAALALRPGHRLGDPTPPPGDGLAVGVARHDAGRVVLDLGIQLLGPNRLHRGVAVVAGPLVDAGGLDGQPRPGQQGPALLAHAQFPRGTRWTRRAGAPPRSGCRRRPRPSPEDRTRRFWRLRRALRGAIEIDDAIGGGDRPEPGQLHALGGEGVAGQLLGVLELVGCPGGRADGARVGHRHLRRFGRSAMRASRREPMVWMTPAIAATSTTAATPMATRRHGRWRVTWGVG